MAELPERHGHWPLVSAAAAGPVATGMLIIRRDVFVDDGAWARWLPLAALLMHQTEEWVWPGNFLPWFNRQVMESGQDEFPITRRDGLIINVGMGWAVGVVAGVGGERFPGLAAAQLTMVLGNAGLHLAQVAKTRTYNPGSLTAVALFVPLGIAGMRRLRKEGRGRQVAIGAAVGAASAIGLMAVMRRRMRAS